MMRLIRAGLERQGLEPPRLPRLQDAHVPLDAKRDALRALLRRHGPRVVLRLGEAVEDAPDEPALVALALARDPVDLMDRWQRLERYIHSRHRVVTIECGKGRLVVRHVAHRGPLPPLPVEDLLVFGLLTSLMELIGARDVRARIFGEREWCRRDRQWRGGTLSGDGSTWEFSWAPQPTPGPVTRSPISGGDRLDTARRALEADLGRRWTVAALAGALHTSVRSLQRHLASNQSSFSKLMADVRMARAAVLLTTSAHSPAEIGYVCGFSDQAHFTRTFRRHAALTPSAYRSQFQLENP